MVPVVAVAGRGPVRPGPGRPDGVGRASPARGGRAQASRRLAPWPVFRRPPVPRRALPFSEPAKRREVGHEAPAGEAEEQG